MPDTAPSYKGYRIYPRGFLGASLGEQIKPTERAGAAALKTHNYHPDWFKGLTNPKEVNRNIESMWRHMNDHHHSIDDMEFREKVLRIALNAFGTSDFLEWVMIQQNGPSTGDMHMEFLRNTLEFIQTGKRAVGLHAWTTMLSTMDITHNQTKDDGSFTWFFVDDNKSARNVALIDVIQRWCSHPNGFADMIQTLHVLFGEVEG
jgi:hypothetical protein